MRSRGYGHGSGMTNTATETPTPSIPSDPVELEQFVQRLLAEGESIASFCRRTGTHPWKLYRAKQRLAKREVEGARGKRVDLAPVRVRPDQDAAPIELVLAGGHRLKLTADFDEIALRRLLGVLASC